MQLVWREAGPLGELKICQSHYSFCPSAFSQQPLPPALAEKFMMPCRLSRPCHFHLSQDVAGIAEEGVHSPRLQTGQYDSKKKMMEHKEWAFLWLFLLCRSLQLSQHVPPVSHPRL